MASCPDDNSDLEIDLQSLRKQQRFMRMPKRIGAVLTDLLSLRGYAQSDAARRRETVWEQAAGPLLAAHSRPTEIRRGVLTVIARNSLVLQEISLQKEHLLRQLADAIPEQKVRDLRLRVGKLD